MHQPNLLTRRLSGQSLTFGKKTKKTMSFLKSESKKLGSVAYYDTKDTFELLKYFSDQGVLTGDDLKDLVIESQHSIKQVIDAKLTQITTILNKQFEPIKEVFKRFAPESYEGDLFSLRVLDNAIYIEHQYQAELFEIVKTESDLNDKALMDLVYSLSNQGFVPDLSDIIFKNELVDIFFHAFLNNSIEDLHSLKQGIESLGYETFEFMDVLEANLQNTEYRGDISEYFEYMHGITKESEDYETAFEEVTNNLDYLIAHKKMQLHRSEYAEKATDHNNIYSSFLKAISPYIIELSEGAHSFEWFNDYVGYESYFGVVNYPLSEVNVDIDEYFNHGWQVDECGMIKVDIKDPAFIKNITSHISAFASLQVLASIKNNPVTDDVNAESQESATIDAVAA